MGSADPFHSPDQARRRRRREVGLEGVLFPPDTTPDPLSRLVENEDEEETRRALDAEMDRRGLTVKERMVYVLVVGCRQPVRRTAWIMRSTRTTVHRWLQEARRKMEERQ